MPGPHWSRILSNRNIEIAFSNENFNRYVAMNTNRSDMKKRDAYGNTILHKLVRMHNFGDEEVFERAIRYIVTNRIVSVNATNFRGETPLHVCREEYIDVLCSLGGSVNARDNQGRTPFDTAVSTYSMVDLMQWGAIPDLQSINRFKKAVRGMSRSLGYKYAQNQNIKNIPRWIRDAVPLIVRQIYDNDAKLRHTTIIRDAIRVLWNEFPSLMEEYMADFFVRNMISVQNIANARPTPYLARVLKIERERLRILHAATTIQRHFLRCYYDPQQPICKRRMSRQFAENSRLLSKIKNPIIRK